MCQVWCRYNSTMNIPSNERERQWKRQLTCARPLTMRHNHHSPVEESRLHLLNYWTHSLPGIHSFIRLCHVPSMFCPNFAPCEQDVNLSLAIFSSFTRKKKIPTILCSLFMVCRKKLCFDQKYNLGKGSKSFLNHVKERDILEWENHRKRCSDDLKGYKIKIKLLDSVFRYFIFI